MFTNLTRNEWEIGEEKVFILVQNAFIPFPSISNIECQLIAVFKFLGNLLEK